MGVAHSTVVLLSQSPTDWADAVVLHRQARAMAPQADTAEVGFMLDVLVLSWWNWQRVRYTPDASTCWKKPRAAALQNGGTRLPW